MNIFYTPDIDATNYVLDEAESKHCIRVLRHSTGDLLTLIDGKGGWFEARITDPNPKRCGVEVVKSMANYKKKNYRLHVAIAPTKNIERLEWFLEKATEIGIDEITPILCEHSERKQIKNERLEKVVIAAMKQSLKAFLPQLNNLTNFDAFVKQAEDSNKFIAHCEDGEKKHLFHLAKPSGNVLVLIGPEGDFSPAEIQLAKDNGFQEISLGESRLRTETAGIVATQIIQLINEK
ncbi:MAG: 16S rRNA (uracil(1498)-N(3))-methyltransferase [Prolixibacteraceae bacterium]